MKKLLLILAISCSTLLHAQNIPQDWLGDWYGILEITTNKGLFASINMELHLAKTDTINNWSYVLIYDDGKTRDERKYNLIRSDSIQGLYIVNENNGILLYEVQMGNRMLQRFEVMDNVIYGITTYEKGKIIWEIISDNEEIKIQSGNGDENSPFVNAYFPSNYQRAVLTKKKPKPTKKKTDHGK